MYYGTSQFIVAYVVNILLLLLVICCSELRSEKYIRTIKECSNIFLCVQLNVDSKFTNCNKVTVSFESPYKYLFLYVGT